MKKESRRELQCKDDELEDARAASGKKVMTVMVMVMVLVMVVVMVMVMTMAVVMVIAMMIS